MTWVAVGVGVVGAVGGAYSSNQAKKGQQAGTDAALGEQGRQYDQTRADNMPGLDARNNALWQMQNRAQQYGNGQPSAADVMATPGYQFGLDQGQNALQTGAAARGGLYSGAAGKALVQYGNDYGTGKYDDAFNRLQTSHTNDFNRWASVSGQGQTGANAIAGAGMNAANNSSNLYSAQGNANAGAAITNGNAYAGLANNIGSAGKSWWENRAPGSSYTTPNANGSYNNPTGSGFGTNNTGDSLPTRGGWADGGPVTAQPPRMSESHHMRDSLIQMLTGTKPTPQYVLPDAPIPVSAPVAVMPANVPINAVTNPQGILERRMKQAGAYADGGPVRHEPQIGMRSPLPSGGGGGMSHDALMAALTGQPQQMQPQMQPPMQVAMRSGIGALPANPLTDPRAITANRLQQAGAYAHGGAVHGPGGPRDDLIPAQLSDGEHIFDTASVNAMGGGDNARGQQKLNMLREALKRGAH